MNGFPKLAAASRIGPNERKTGPPPFHEGWEGGERCGFFGLLLFVSPH